MPVRLHLAATFSARARVEPEYFRTLVFQSSAFYFHSERDTLASANG